MRLPSDYYSSTILPVHSAGGVYCGGGVTSLLFPGGVLPDARRGHSVVNLCLRRVPCASDARHGSHDLCRLV